jgi:hypothetical protein
MNAARDTLDQRSELETSVSCYQHERGVSSRVCEEISANPAEINVVSPVTEWRFRRQSLNRLQFDGLVALNKMDVEAASYKRSVLTAEWTAMIATVRGVPFAGSVLWSDRLPIQILLQYSHPGRCIETAFGLTSPALGSLLLR